MEDLPMKWVEKFLDQLDESLEWQSLGTMSWRFHEDENWLRLAPSPIEMVGGADDGESVYPLYSLCVAKLIEVFDEPPEMYWNTRENEFSIDGKIDGQDASITFLREPFDDEEPGHALDPDGGLRRKKPPQE